MPTSEGLLADARAITVGADAVAGSPSSCKILVAVFPPGQAVGPVEQSGDLGGGVGGSREHVVALYGLRIIEVARPLVAGSHPGGTGRDVQVEVDGPPGASPFGAGEVVRGREVVTIVPKRPGPGGSRSGRVVAHGPPVRTQIPSRR